MSSVLSPGPGRHQRRRHLGHRPALAGHQAALAGRAAIRATWDQDRQAAYDLGRDRIAALVVQGLIVFVPCLVWFLYYDRLLSVCGSAVPDTAAQCSGVVSRCLISLAGLILSGLVTAGSITALVILVIRARRPGSARPGPGSG